jgi:carboxypeptidase C (cathepsin A)
MYAGTVETTRQYPQSHNLFYWLVKNTTLDKKAPLIIWIQGEPGVSAMRGLFVQNGPLTTDGSSVSLAPSGSSLTEVGDVLYLDQPVGTGFSYGLSDTDVATSLDQVAHEFINFLSSFLGMYPEYASPRKVFLMGEDFAGKFLPRFAKEINQFTEKGGSFNLKAIFIGNPASTVQKINSYKTARALSLVDSSNFG